MCNVISRSSDSVLATVRYVSYFNYASANGIAVTLMDRCRAIQPWTFSNYYRYENASINYFLPISVRVIMGRGNAACKESAGNFVFRSRLFGSLNCRLICRAIATAQTMVRNIVVRRDQFFVGRVLKLSCFFFDRGLVFF